MVDGINTSIGGFSSYYSISQQHQGTKSSIGVFNNDKDASHQHNSISPDDPKNTEKLNNDISQLTEEEKEEVKELKKRDAEVKQHEQAHMAAAGSLARGGPKYEYETGPDGQQYAKAGHVNIDTSKEKDPDKTIQKAQAIKRAALAPVDPSGQDRKVAAKATQMEAEARAESAKEKTEGAETKNPLEALSDGVDVADFAAKMKGEDQKAQNPFNYQKRFEAYIGNVAVAEQDKADAAPDMSSGVVPETETFET